MGANEWHERLAPQTRPEMAAKSHRLLQEAKTRHRATVTNPSSESRTRTRSAPAGAKQTQRTAGGAIMRAGAQQNSAPWQQFAAGVGTSYIPRPVGRLVEL